MKHDDEIEERYTPIACSLHDELEALASQSRRVAISYEQDGVQAQLDDVIADWFVRDGVEYMRTRSGAEIRLDRIVALNGMRFRDPQ